MIVCELIPHPSTQARRLSSQCMYANFNLHLFIPSTLDGLRVSFAQRDSTRDDLLGHLHVILRHQHRQGERNVWQLRSTLKVQG